MESTIGTSKGLVSGLRSTHQSLNDGLSSLNGEWRTLLPETRAWLSQLTVYPSYFYAKAVDTLIRTLIADNIWPFLDRMWLFATEQRQHATVSIVNPNGINAAWPTNITEVNSITWKLNVGYTGNGTSTYLNTNYAPATNGVNCTGNTNSASLGIYLNKAPTNAATTCEFGASNNPNAGGFALVYSYLTIGHSVAELMDGNVATYNSVLPGLWSGIRNNSSTTQSMWNKGTKVQSNTVTSVLNNYVHNMYVFAYDNSSALYYSNATISMAYVGGGTISQYLLNQIFQQFATTIGFNV